MGFAKLERRSAQLTALARKRGGCLRAALLLGISGCPLLSSPQLLLRGCDRLDGRGSRSRAGRVRGAGAEGAQTPASPRRKRSCREPALVRLVFVPCDSVRPNIKAPALFLKRHSSRCGLMKQEAQPVKVHRGPPRCVHVPTEPSRGSTERGVGEEGEWASIFGDKEQETKTNYAAVP